MSVINIYIFNRTNRVQQHSHGKHTDKKHGTTARAHPIHTTYCDIRKLYIGSVARNAVIRDMTNRNTIGANWTITA